MALRVSAFARTDVRYWDFAVRWHTEAMGHKQTLSATSRRQDLIKHVFGTPASMNIPNNLDKLTALFERLGARQPEVWATSQLKEGTPQLQRFLFLRQAWSNVICENDTDWMQLHIQSAEKNPDGPYAGVGHALRRCLDRGASAQDLNDIVRGMQAGLLFSLCYLLDDPSFSEQELNEFAWGLFEVDRDGNPVLPCIGGLHESVLETDPTGREMRPRKESS
jgi:hypothetical protein